MTKRQDGPDGWSEAALDALIGETRTPAELEVLFRQLKQRMVEQVLQAELTEHLGYPPGTGRGLEGNARNGTTPKTALTDEGALPLAIPRDRAGSFTPQFVPKGCGGSRASTRRCCRSTPAASPCGTPWPTWKNATRCRSRPT
ncbi:MAG: transposase [Gemmatimonadota bacterium]|nr:transposase [Gemmatimonadota bacterium]